MQKSSKYAQTKNAKVSTDLYDKEKVDLETIIVEDVFRLLQCNDNGSMTEEAQRRLELFDPNKLELEEQNAFLQHRLELFSPNKLESEEQNVFLHFLSFMWNLLSWGHGGCRLGCHCNGEHQPPDWQDFVSIVLLLLVKVKVKRDCTWQEIESAGLVPGNMVSFKLAALTGESLPQSKKTGDQCFLCSTCKQGEAEGVIILTSPNTFFGCTVLLVGQDDDTTRHLQKILAQIGSFCLVIIGIFLLAEIFCLYAGFSFQYCCGLNNILVLLIGEIPIAMPMVLSVTLAVSAQQLAKYKAIIICITAIEELATVTILFSDKMGTLTANKLTVDCETICTYGPFSIDAINTCIIFAIGNPSRARAGIKLLDCKPFNPLNKRTEIMYHEESSNKLKCVTKGMTGIIIELCTHSKTEKIEFRPEANVEELVSRGLHTLAVMYEELDSEDPEGEGNAFELIGLLSIFDPPRDDIKQTINNTIALDVCIKIVTGDQLTITKETGCHLSLGDHMYLTQVLKDGSAPGSKHALLD
ncbi:plasma-membrane proton-e [Sparassis crispa]|uniref:Plasma-membrane proton-e n=1 Tax=Sparassis crispa TaxID=139825 RepID=A0A401GJT3_9APHY|nr:plasma-membrane proton-e [Sparassis crispa]GBE82414.1 plasma-membrane proton-e [Sparassis crispa]